MATEPNYIVNFKKNHPDAILPTRKHGGFNGTGDSGYDLFSVEDVVVPAKSTVKVNVGLIVADMSPNIWMRLESRSGLYFKHGIEIFNGIIDQNFRGVLGCALTNHSDVDYQVLKGDKIAQYVLYPLIEADTKFVEEVSDTERGAKGFGSSGR